MASTGNHNNCSKCVTTTKRGRITSQTLVYHTIYECKGTIIGNCIHNQTQYGLCKAIDRDWDTGGCGDIG